MQIFSIIFLLSAHSYTVRAMVHNSIMLNLQCVKFCPPAEAIHASWDIPPIKSMIEHVALNFTLVPTSKHRAAHVLPSPAHEIPLSDKEADICVPLPNPKVMLIAKATIQNYTIYGKCGPITFPISGKHPLAPASSHASSPSPTPGSMSADQAQKANSLKGAISGAVIAAFLLIVAVCLTLPKTRIRNMIEEFSNRRGNGGVTWPRRATYG
ncbi:hypothetical protein BDQ17DRAFT_1373631 [Cyathus striatus]|nr:hypothetical protein BDQ17DRAFT_1373631 [Cyathus striatus]